MVILRVYFIDGREVVCHAGLDDSVLLVQALSASPMINDVEVED